MFNGNGKKVNKKKIIEMEKKFKKMEKIILLGNARSKKGAFHRTKPSTLAKVKQLYSTQTDSIVVRDNHLTEIFLADIYLREKLVSCFETTA